MAAVMLCMLLCLGRAVHAATWAWIVPLPTPGLLQRFHVTVQSIRESQPDPWIVAVVSITVHDKQMARSVARVTNQQVTVHERQKHGVTDFLPYFKAGFKAAHDHQIKNTTGWIVWAAVDMIFLLPLQLTLDVEGLPPDTVMATATESSQLHTVGEHMAIFGHGVFLDPKATSLVDLIWRATARVRIQLNATYAARATDLQNYRDQWVREKLPVCVKQPWLDRVFCGITAVYYDLTTFSPWFWWTYPLIPLNHPWVVYASHVAPNNIPWVVWMAKIAHIFVIFGVFMLGWWFYTMRPWLKPIRRGWPAKQWLGPRYRHISWLVRFVFFTVYLFTMLVYPEELWPVYGWAVAIGWMAIVCFTVFNGFYFPWMRHQGRYAPVVMVHELSSDMQDAYRNNRYVDFTPLIYASKAAFYRAHLWLYLSIVFGLFLIGLVIGRGQSRLVVLAAVMFSVISATTGIVNTTVTWAATAAYEMGVIDRIRKEKRDAYKQS